MINLTEKNYRFVFPKKTKGKNFTREFIAV